MKQYIKKSALIAEIKKLMSIYNDDESIIHTAKYNILVDILSLLDTIESKEADEECNGKAMLHVLEKGVEQGRRELIDKACEWLKKWDAYRVCLEGNKDWFIEQFRKAMKE